MQKRWIASLALLLAGCSQPASLPTFALGSGDVHYAESGGSGVRDLLALPATTGVVARCRAGKAPKAPAHGTLKQTLAASNTRIYSARSAAERDALLSELAKDPAVDLAEPDYPLAVSGTFAPNDTMLPQQWSLPAINVPKAWALSLGDKQIVAVLDSGVDLNHPDLQGQVSAGGNLIDGGTDVRDDLGHGTHVAGIIAAAANNAKGIAGVAPHCHIVAYKVADAQGRGSAATVAEGILLAAGRGARIINVSMGSPYDAAVLRDAVARATAAGVAVIVAAGNDGSTAPSYPGADPGALCVGATTTGDARASFSNHGPTVAIAAPGASILSTTKGTYQYLQGTSMAAPHVAGAAALVWALHPSWSLNTLKAALETTGARCSGFETNPNVRRLDVLAALNAVGPNLPPPPSLATTAAATGGSGAQGQAVATLPAGSVAAQPAAALVAPAFTTIQMSAATASGAELSWTTTVPASGQVLLGTSPTGLSVVAPTQVAADLNHHQTLTGLAPNGTYYLQIRATSVGGTSTLSPLLTIHTQPLLVTSAGLSPQRTTASANWSTNTSSNSTICWGLAPTTLGNSVDTSPSLSHSATLKNLNAGTMYYFQFRTRDTQGNTSYSPVWSFMTAK